MNVMQIFFDTETENELTTHLGTSVVHGSVDSFPVKGNAHLREEESCISVG